MDWKFSVFIGFFVVFDSTPAHIKKAPRFAIVHAPYLIRSRIADNLFIHAVPEDFAPRSGTVVIRCRDSRTSAGCWLDFAQSESCAHFPKAGVQWAAPVELVNMPGDAVVTCGYNAAGDNDHGDGTSWGARFGVGIVQLAAALKDGCQLDP